MMREWMRTVSLVGGVALVAGCASQKPKSAAAEPKPAPAPAAAAPAPAPAPAPAAKSAPIVIDNQDSAGRFTTTGNWSADPAGGDFADTDCHWTTPWGDASARWEAKLPQGGNWKVFIWYGRDPNDDHASDATYTIETADGPKTVKLNQKENQAQWNLVGTYRFEAGKVAAVVLSNKADGNVLADAVKFEPE